MIWSTINRRIFVKTASGRHIGFKSDNRLDRRGQTDLVKFNRSIHGAKICQSQGLKPAGLGSFYQGFDLCQTVKQRIVRMDMKMDKVVHSIHIVTRATAVVQMCKGQVKMSYLSA